MRRYLLVIAALLSLFSPAAQAANSTVNAMTAGAAISTTDLFYCVQGAGTLDRKCTPVQLAAFVFGDVSGDLTCSGTGTCTLSTVNANVGTFGSATTSAQVTLNAKGLATAASSVTITPAVGSVTGLGTGVATALGVNIGSAGAFVTNGGALGTPSSGTLTSATGLPISTGVSGLGTGVATAAGTALSAAGGLTSTIASGTAALGTTAISSGTCATAVTVSATNVATTDTVTASFNGDPTAVTGYIPTTNGMLTIIGFPTSGNVNFKVCNNTAASITPGAITLNWRVVR